MDHRGRLKTSKLMIKRKQSFPCVYKHAYEFDSKFHVVQVYEWLVSFDGLVTCPGCAPSTGYSGSWIIATGRFEFLAWFIYQNYNDLDDWQPSQTYEQLVLNWQSSLRRAFRFSQLTYCTHWMWRKPSWSHLWKVTSGSPGSCPLCQNVHGCRC